MKNSLINKNGLSFEKIVPQEVNLDKKLSLVKPINSTMEYMDKAPLI